jgi:DNA polymerase, archaea type
MVQALESRFRVEECSFNNIFGSFQCHRIYASRKVAEKIETQTRYAAELYNVDVRQDQRYLAEKDLFPCGDRDESRPSPDFEVPLSSQEIQVQGAPTLPREITRVQALDSCKRRFEGSERVVLADPWFMKVHDPDVILFPFADTWVPLIVKEGEKAGAGTYIQPQRFFQVHEQLRASHKI